MKPFVCVREAAVMVGGQHATITRDFASKGELYKIEIRRTVTSRFVKVMVRSGFEAAKRAAVRDMRRHETVAA